VESVRPAEKTPAAAISHVTPRLHGGQPINRRLKAYDKPSCLLREVIVRPFEKSGLRRLRHQRHEEHYLPPGIGRILDHHEARVGVAERDLLAVAQPSKAGSANGR